MLYLIIYRFLVSQPLCMQMGLSISFFFFGCAFSFNFKLSLKSFAHPPASNKPFFVQFYIKSLKLLELSTLFSFWGTNPNFFNSGNLNNFLSSFTTASLPKQVISLYLNSVGTFLTTPIKVFVQDSSLLPGIFSFPST